MCFINTQRLYAYTAFFIVLIFIYIDVFLNLLLSPYFLLLKTVLLPAVLLFPESIVPLWGLILVSPALEGWRRIITEFVVWANNEFQANLGYRVRFCPENKIKQSTTKVFLPSINFTVLALGALSERQYCYLGSCIFI